MRPLLGTFVEIRATGASPKLEDAVAAAFAAVELVHKRMSFHEPTSDVSRINTARSGEIVCVAPETHTVLRAARTLGDLSGGAFDIATAAALLVSNGFLPPPGGDSVGPPPSPEPPALGGESQAPCAQAIADPATYRDLELLPNDQVVWRRKGWIDLGGIAKGYAVDQAVAALRSHGLTSGLVNAGGDLRCFGVPQPIHLRAPQNPTALLHLGTLANAAIATSADYFNSREEGNSLSESTSRIGALVDPHHTRCRLWGCSVSVVASDCLTADALTKIVALVPECAPTLLEKLEAQSFIVDRQGIQVCGWPRLLLSLSP
jgi:thiamine biosynthesis lipoprotein